MSSMQYFSEFSSLWCADQRHNFRSPNGHELPEISKKVGALQYFAIRDERPQEISLISSKRGRKSCIKFVGQMAEKFYTQRKRWNCEVPQLSSEVQTWSRQHFEHTRLRPRVLSTIGNIAPKLMGMTVLAAWILAVMTAGAQIFGDNCEIDFFANLIHLMIVLQQTAYPWKATGQWNRMQSLMCPAVQILVEITVFLGKKTCLTYDSKRKLQLYHR